MFSKNGHSLASSTATEYIPAERLLGNRLILGELEYDIRMLKGMPFLFIIS
jgi:hypothetical protein